ncbi:MAG: hypothetical protein UCH84_05735 [Eubacterium sp.]|nr:hypothetical protein [Eubacterium sp.]
MNIIKSIKKGQIIMAIAKRNKEKDVVISCWYYFYRMQILESGDLKNKLYAATVKYQRACEESDEKNIKKYDKMIQKLEKKYNSSEERLQLIEELNDIRREEGCEFSSYKTYDVETGGYVDRPIMKFKGTDYCFKKNEKAIFQLSSQLYKGEKMIISH